jgi:hypothetical protein
MAEISPEPGPITRQARVSKAPHFTQTGCHSGLSAWHRPQT